MGSRRRGLASRPLIEFTSTIVAVAIALSVAFVLNFDVFRIVLLVVTVAVTSMWVLARR